MYTFFAGKDASEEVTAATFLPSWWFDDEGGEPAEETREAKMAKFAQVFGALGGQSLDGS